MLIRSLDVPRAEFEARTGWDIKPQGACKDERCVPLPRDMSDESTIDLRVLTERLGMPIVHDDGAGMYAIGPETGRALATAVAPDFTLPRHDGGEFTLSSLRGQKVFLLAWASW